MDPLPVVTSALLNQNSSSSFISSSQTLLALDPRRRVEEVVRTRGANPLACDLPLSSLSTRDAAPLENYRSFADDGNGPDRTAVGAEENLSYLLFAGSNTLLPGDLMEETAELVSQLIRRANECIDNRGIRGLAADEDLVKELQDVKKTMSVLNSTSAGRFKKELKEVKRLLKLVDKYNTSICCCFWSCCK